eukprot:CAMPEP_0113666050 /NCGR_PEP_ID=MMETSP0038_2-20120614/2651_1 /TAXON_ID=2898 /ORGANISM="Cryptomonas paramecium" /LENGTH=55 /DNA_ID=CAMNT_0000581483 /DNA_START=157 /DNA_END=324 /DNA_ORIENTATION=- /assembly_acc=CAM_ASM_000170
MTRAPHGGEMNLRGSEGGNDIAGALEVPANTRTSLPRERKLQTCRKPASKSALLI